MNYEKLESEVLARLQPLVAAGFIVELLPEVERDNARPPAGKARVTVAYKSSDFGEHKTMNEAAQEETASLEIMYECQKLRGVGGLYSLRNAAFALLFGYQPSDWSKLAAKNFTLVDRIDGFWLYSETFTCTGIAVETIADSTDPLTTMITVDNTTVSN